jgi:hypothetical protein
MRFDTGKGVLFEHDDDATIFSGIATKSVGSTSVTAGKVYYLKANTFTQNPEWDLADADFNEDHASHMLGFAIVTGTVSSRSIALQGFVFLEEHGFAIGAPLYLSNTEGLMTNTVPTSGWARICGYAVSENAIYFDPDKTYVEIP